MPHPLNCPVSFPYTPAPNPCTHHPDPPTHPPARFQIVSRPHAPPRVFKSPLFYPESCWQQQGFRTRKAASGSHLNCTRTRNPCQPIAVSARSSHLPRPEAMSMPNRAQLASPYNPKALSPMKQVQASRYDHAQAHHRNQNCCCRPP